MVALHDTKPTTQHVDAQQVATRSFSCRQRAQDRILLQPCCGNGSASGPDRLRHRRAGAVQQLHGQARHHGARLHALQHPLLLAVLPVLTLLCRRANDTLGGAGSELHLQRAADLTLSSTHCSSQTLVVAPRSADWLYCWSQSKKKNNHMQHTG